MSSAARREHPIVHVAAPAEYGGLESVLISLAGAQATRGPVVAILSDAADDHPVATELRVRGVRVILPSLGTRSYVRERGLVRGMLRDLNPRVVHSHGYRPDILHAPLARRLGIPAVSTVHGITGSGARTWLYHQLEWRSLRRLPRVIAVSRPLVEALIDRGIRAERIALVPNAFDSDRPALPRSAAREALGLAADRYIVGWVGRLSHEKGPDLLLAGVARAALPALHVAFVGDGSEAAELRHQCAALGLDARVTWLGPLPSASTYLAAFDCFALTSRTEGTPMVLFEAMRAQTPIIAARVGGVPDVVSDAEAILVDPEQPDEIARALHRLVSEPNEGQCRAERAAARLAETYTVSAWVDAHEQVYDEADSLVSVRSQIAPAH